MSSALLGQVLVPDAMARAVGDEAWLQAMLDVEAALARAQARAGVIPAEAAAAIADACRAEHFDAARIGREARGPGNPAAPLASALADAVGAEARRWVHWGATSQDVLDTAAMLVSRRALEAIGADVDAVAAACAGLAEAHRDTPMAARTLLQQALPTTFGLKAAGWLAGVLDAREGLERVRLHGLAAQLGGAAGTLASLGDRGTDVAAAFAAELGLAEPELPWHANRVRVAALGSALAITAGALAKVALDIELMAQTEVGELAEGGGGGGSSTLPQKRNPIASARARACASRVQAAAGLLVGGMAQEHERAAGAWHAEWEPLTEALALTGGAAAAVREALEGLDVDAGRMRANLEATGGLVMAEHAMLALAEHVGRPEAKRVVGEAAARALDGGRPFRDELRDDQAVTAHLSAEQIDRALDPAAYLGSAATFVDRALERHRTAGA